LAPASSSSSTAMRACTCGSRTRRWPLAPDSIRLGQRLTAC
jgi:hypothetical protein